MNLDQKIFDLEKALAETWAALGNEPEPSLLDRDAALLDELAATPARTLAGIKCKARLLRPALMGEDLLVESLLFDIATL